MRPLPLVVVLAACGPGEETLSLGTGPRLPVVGIGWELEHLRVRVGASECSFEGPQDTFDLCTVERPGVGDTRLRLEAPAPDGQWVELDETVTLTDVEALTALRVVTFGRALWLELAQHVEPAGDFVLKRAWEPRTDEWATYELTNTTGETLWGGSPTGFVFHSGGSGTIARYSTSGTWQPVGSMGCGNDLGVADVRPGATARIHEHYFFDRPRKLSVGLYQFRLRVSSSRELAPHVSLSSELELTDLFVIQNTK